MDFFGLFVMLWGEAFDIFRGNVIFQISFQIDFLLLNKTV